MKKISFDQSLSAVESFEGMPFFDKVGPAARKLIAEKLMRLINVDVAAFVQADCARYGFSAWKIMTKWNPPERFFNSLQFGIVRDLVNLGASIDDMRDHIWFPEDLSSQKFKISSADQRLKNFVDKFIEVQGGWPGIAEMALLYMSMYRSGDGYKTDATSSIPGYTWQDHHNGTNVPLLPQSPEPDYKQLAAGEQPMTPEEHKQLADQFAGVLENMRVKQEASA